MQSIASKFGMAAETLRSWVRQAERETLSGGSIQKLSHA
jgi:transposase-like protein